MGYIKQDRSWPLEILMLMAGLRESIWQFNIHICLPSRLAIALQPAACRCSGTVHVQFHYLFIRLCMRHAVAH